jgi:hypothetical protein
MRLLITTFLIALCAPMVRADEPTTRPDHISIDIKRNNWEPMVMTTLPDPPADNVSMDLTKDNPMFTSREPGANGVFEYRLHAPINSKRYPFMIVHYRAKNLDVTKERAGIAVDPSAGRGLMTDVFQLKDFTADGEEHELKKDLRELKPKSTIGRILLILTAAESGEASLELISVEFEAEPDSQPAEAKDGSPLAIAVFDAQGQAIKGAKVVIDAERKGAASDGETNDQGEVTITPRETETGVHALQVQAEGMATYFATLEKKSPGATVNMTSAATYGGIVQNEEGQPIEGATVRIYAPPPANERPFAARMIRRAVMKTDAEGKWKSPPLPEGDCQVITKLAHPDYAADKQYRGGQDEPPIQEMKDGTGVMVLKK